MDKHNKISVRMNGQETSLDKEQTKEKEEWNDPYLEQAATLDKTLDNNNISELEKIDSSNKGSKRKISMPPKVKTFLFAAVSAVIIGVVLGFVMLRMFVGIDEGSGQANGYGEVQPSGSASTSTSNGEDTEETGGGTFNPEEIKTYVVQGGVFSTDKKANEWQTQFKDAGYESIIWERDGQYFLFAGISKTEQKADKMAASLSEKQLDTYVKPWSLNTGDKKLNGEQVNRLDTYTTIWSNTLEGINNPDDASLNTEKWEKWISEVPEDSRKNLKHLIEPAEQFLQVDNEDLDENKLQINLLKGWRGLEYYLNN